MYWNCNFFHNWHLFVDRNVFDHRYVLVNRNMLHVHMMNVTCVNIVWDVDYNVLAENKNDKKDIKNLVKSWISFFLRNGSSANLDHHDRLQIDHSCDLWVWIDYTIRFGDAGHRTGSDGTDKNWFTKLFRLEQLLKKPRSISEQDNLSSSWSRSDQNPVWTKPRFTICKWKWSKAVTVFYFRNYKSHAKVLRAYSKPGFFFWRSGSIWSCSSST